MILVFQADIGGGDSLSPNEVVWVLDDVHDTVTVGEDVLVRKK